MVNLSDNHLENTDCTRVKFLNVSVNMIYGEGNLKNQFNISLRELKRDLLNWSLNSRFVSNNKKYLYI